MLLVDFAIGGGDGRNKSVHIGHSRRGPHGSRLNTWYRWKDGTMLNHARRRASRMLAVPFVASVCLFWECDTRAQSAGDLPPAQEPWLPEPGDRYAVFNPAVIACYQGSMMACDSIGLNDQILMDSFLGQYGRTCGGRANLRAIRRENLSCTEAFPGHE